MPLYKTKKTKDGKQGYMLRINYKDSNGEYKTITRSVYGMTEAKMLEQSLLAQISNNDVTANMTLTELYNEYIQVKKAEIRETSLDKTSSILSLHVLPFFSQKTKLDSLDKKKLQAWKQYVLDKKLSTITNQHIYGEFRALLNYAEKMDYIKQNNLTKLGNFKDVYFQTPQDKLHYYTAEQFKRFITVAETNSKTPSECACLVFFYIAFYTGMRKGEINALKWNDIDGDVIHVRRSVAQKIKGKTIVETPPKNKSSYRDLQMPKKLAEVLNKHKEYQMQDTRFTNEYRVCGGLKCLPDTTISEYNIACAKQADLPHITVHDFRHSHASLLANERINIQEISRRLGHSKIEQTWNTYSHLYPREEERAVEILDSI